MLFCGAKTSSLAATMLIPNRIITQALTTTNLPRGIAEIAKERIQKSRQFEPNLEPRMLFFAYNSYYA